MAKSMLQRAQRELIADLQAQLVAYKAIVNQVLAIVLDAPGLEADYAHPPPIELMPDTFGTVDVARLRDWWLRVLEGYAPTIKPSHSRDCETGAACWECGVCGDCGRYVGSGE